jgi:hypothetical protein
VAWTQTDIDLLKAAIARGVKRVQYADREVEYPSLKEMRELLAEMEAVVTTPSDSLTSGGRSTLATFSRD